MSQEIIFVELCQKIQDEITRLEASRTSYNPFVTSSDLKIQILNQLLQVILAPERFPPEILDKYFKDELTGAHQAKSLPDLIDILLNDTTLCKNNATGKVEAVTNQTLINENRNIFHHSATTKNSAFYQDLKEQFKDLRIAPPAVKQYSLHAYKKELDPVADKGKLFIRWDEDNKVLKYKVINPKGEIVSNTISEEALKAQLGDRYAAFNETLANHHLPVPFLFDLLQITSRNGDTYHFGPQRTYNRIVYLGDSLTDKGEMYDSILGAWSGLIGTSPNKSFSNTRVWADGMDNMMAEELLKKVVAEHLGIKGYRNFLTCTQQERRAIQEAIVDLDQHLKDQYKASFGLDNNSRFTIKDDDGNDVVFSITKAIGGLTAYSYAGVLSINPVRTIMRYLLSTLAKQREELLEIEKDVPAEERAKTVVHILAGANDLVTVNTRPSHEEVDHAVDAILETMEILWQNGYRQFALSDLPDLSRTPRYQYESRIEQLNAHVCSEYFNRQLEMRLAQFKSKHLDSAVDVFGLHDLLQDGIDNPKKYGFSTEYELSEVDDSKWSKLSYLSEGCSFYRVPEGSLDALFDEIKTRAYVRTGNLLYYIDKTDGTDAFTLILSGKDEVAEFDKKVKCADKVKMLPENKLADISKLLRDKAAHDQTPVARHFAPQTTPKQNKIYYQIKANEFHYQTMDVYDRLRKDKVSKEDLLKQVNGCALLRATICPVDKQTGEVKIDIPSGAAFVRYQNQLFYIRRSAGVNDFEVEKTIDLTDEQLDDFDARFKPWYASKQLSEDEQAKCRQMFDAPFSPPAKIDDLELDTQHAPGYVPYLQAILAERDHVVARGDIFTPAQNTQAFKRLLEESGPVMPGDVTPTSNKAFNDLLHPLGDMGARWTDKFFNEFLAKLYLYVPAAEKFKHFIEELIKPDLSAKASDKEQVEPQVKTTEAAELLVDTSELVKAFAVAYNDKLVAEKKENSSIFSFFHPHKPEKNLLPELRELDGEEVLQTVFGSAKETSDNRTHKVLQSINWMTAEGKLTAWAEQVPQLKQAFSGENHQLLVEL
ncbi:Autotransporter protein or domain, integral membrane beta-barrel involved in protein secretion [Legionella massiliensis]|uniref:Autotransporter protein or domain, integral membrane beta-barrel involved in protein secretion n=1 Tax=Legionella massiliensis TaxID=1034943 RepID=A0A078KT45_9GAMM|nr:SGNH/GDSL hydrolase family protein [Legionella massiliensis]CDZ77625.1 Autotransporter protein or domain, integral membrane beta-barrel involved in protein secretion [Legionella massiliensis]CEE13363.1 GDSL-like Lipase/Acylhydrolase [Legionella massiliensis]